MARLTSAPPLLLLLLHLICVISSIVFTPSVAVDTLTPKHALTGDGTLVSAGEIFVLGFFTPQGSKYRYLGIWYHFSKVSIQTVVWVANREQPIRDNTGSLWIAGNGTFYVTSGNNNVSIWSSSPSLSLRNPVAQLLDNGNFVVREAGSNASDSKSYAWQSFYHPTDTILPGMEFGWDVDTGLNNTLVAWTSSSDPSPSEFTLILEHHGVPQHEVWKGSTLFWRSGPWNGLRFSGIPVMKSYNMFTFKFEMRPGVVIYTFDELKASFISRLTLNQSGSMQRLLWIQEKQYWNTIWSAPTDQCDTPSLCGTYGVCSTDGDFVCSCIQGFNPRVPATWALRDGSGGCVRNNSLNCKTDGFLLLTGAKLPDTWNSSLDMSLTLEQCRQKCVGNCSCTAYASADISTGLGCLIWVDDLTDIRTFGNGGQDLYVRLAEVDLPKSMRKNNVGKTRVAIVAASLATGIGALALLVCFICWKMKRRDAVLPGTLRNKSNVSPSVSHANRSGVIKDEDGEVELPIYDFETIRAATTNFSPSNMLGEGGFGLVYKGKFAEGQEIAVKRLSKSSVQGTIEFKNEVMLIAKLQHRNLVRLLGCSIAGEERILVYEYMPNKSLDAFLFEKDKGVHLSWQVRFNIIVGIARGLLYLHQDSRLRIIHRDLKAANILLDNDLNPKISDFGLARIFSDDDSMSMTLKVVGTYGYMSPEYAMNGLFSVKSDVFSFGVLVLEIISGVRNKGVFHSKPNDYLLGKAWSLWHDGRSLELIDPLISEECTMAEVMKCIKVGLLCVQEDPEDRPTMSSVVIMLVSDNMTLPEPKQPGFVARKDDMDLQSSGSVSYVTLTNVAGR